MFQRWGFLLGEIWVLLLLAALLGLLAGWLIWGRRSAVAVDTGEADRLRAALETCSAKGRDQVARIAALERDLASAKAAAQAAEADAAAARAASEADAKAARAAVAEAKAASAAAAIPAPAVMAAPLMSAPAAKAKAEAKPAAKPKPVTEAKVDPKTPAKPKGLTKARNDKPDDLKIIKGIGPKLEILCHKLGYFHFDQIAAWTAGEVAWVDDNLEGFKGRVTRDEWVKQAAILAKGGTV